MKIGTLEKIDDYIGIKDNGIYNEFGIYLDKCCTVEKLDIPKKYKLSVEIRISYDIEDGKCRYGVNVEYTRDGFTGWGFYPSKEDNPYNSYKEAKNEALYAISERDFIKNILIETGYLTNGKLEQMSLF
jgi:hypothetical protein